MAGLAILIEMMLKGLPPPRNELGFFTRETGPMRVRLRSDSQAAVNISKMEGLLRRVRHLELRVLVVQEYYALERLLVEFISGKVNGSDCLTKPGDPSH